MGQGKARGRESKEEAEEWGGMKEVKLGRSEEPRNSLRSTGACFRAGLLSLTSIFQRGQAQQAGSSVD